MIPNAAKLDALLDRYASRSNTGPLSFALSSPSSGWSWSYESEAEPKPYFIASITKLYTAAVVMQLRQEGALELDDPIGRYLDETVLSGLHHYKGIDYGHRITVKDLLAHTSGLPGYFDQKRRSGGTLYGEVLVEDRSWTFEDVIEIAKQDMSPKFAPGTPKKAFYSDTNYQLLGRIIENITGTSWEQAVTERVLGPLNLPNTWPFRSSDTERYDEVATLLNGRNTARIPLAMASVRAQGGLVSTAADGIVFLQAFLTGKLFPLKYVAEMQQNWNRIFFPLRYGMGLMRYANPRLLSPGPAPREFIGHSGSSGTVLFHAGASDLYISGNVSQIKNRAMVYQLTSRLAALAK